MLKDFQTYVIFDRSKTCLCFLLLDFGVVVVVVAAIVYMPR